MTRGQSADLGEPFVRTSNGPNRRPPLRASWICADTCGSAQDATGARRRPERTRGDHPSSATRGAGAHLLRAQAHGDAPLHVVLVEPAIPPNTGNVARLCAATGCALHLVEPLGFSIDDRELKRAGLDYWASLDVIACTPRSTRSSLKYAARSRVVRVRDAREACATDRAPFARGATRWVFSASETRPDYRSPSWASNMPSAPCASRCAPAQYGASTSQRAPASLPTLHSLAWGSPISRKGGFAAEAWQLLIP